MTASFNKKMIPPCPSVEEYRSQIDETKRTNELLEDALDAAYGELELTSSALDKAEDTLAGCGDCCEYVRTPRSNSRTPSGSVRGSHPQEGSIVERRGIRMHRDTRDPEF